MFTLKQRKTPWDRGVVKLPAYRGLSIAAEEESGTGRVVAPCKHLIRLHGFYVFDPRRSTNADFRRFLWAGLRVLRTEARARGLSEEQLRQLLVSAFDLFHDTGDGIWAALQSLVSRTETRTTQPGAAEPPVTCEENRPTQSQALATLQRARRRRAAQTRVRRTELDEELRALDAQEE